MKFQRNSVFMLSNYLAMTLVEIYDRIEELLEVIKKNSEDQDCIYRSEIEISYLESLREDLEQNC